MMNFLKRLFSPRKAASKTETPLFDMLLATSPADRRVQIKYHFAGMGNHEILATYHGVESRKVIPGKVSQSRTGQVVA
jgi:hypothetical protein